MKYFVSLFFVLMVTVINPVAAVNGYYPPEQSTGNPAQTIQNALQKLQTFGANSQNSDPKLLHSFIENEIIPHFAFDQMTYWIAGPYARRMNQANMSELEQRVKQTFFNSLGEHLGSYDASTTRVNIRPAQYRGYNQANVTALIYSARQRPDRLDFRMIADGNDWKIIDVKANGNSAAVYYRKHFISTLRQY